MVAFLLTVLLLAASDEVKSFKDLTYYNGPDAHARKHRLNLYLPAARSAYPIVVFVHGGSWTRGDKDDLSGAYGVLAGKFVERGIGVATINYRLAPEFRHPEHARDVARATAWVYRHAKEYGWDPNRLFLVGHSAGAHLAALIAVDPRYLAEQKLTPKIIQGVVGLSGVYDLTLTGVTGRALYEPVFTSDPERLQNASPALQVKVRPSPFLLFYAENDYLSADFQARNFEKVLKKAGGSAVIRLVPGRNHTNIVIGLAKDGDIVQKSVLEFLARN